MVSVDPGEIARALAPPRRPQTPLDVIKAKNDAEKAKAKAQEAAAIASEEVMDMFVLAFQLGPEKIGVNEWIRLGELILSRSIPKVAAQHVQENSDTVDTADTAALRESIVAEFRKRGYDPHV